MCKEETVQEITERKGLENNNRRSYNIDRRKISGETSKGKRQLWGPTSMNS